MLKKAWNAYRVRTLREVKLIFTPCSFHCNHVKAYAPLRGKAGTEHTVTPSGGAMEGEAPDPSAADIRFVIVPEGFSHDKLEMGTLKSSWGGPSNH